MDIVQHNDNDVVLSAHLDSAARLICKDIVSGKLNHIPPYNGREIPSMILTELEMELRVGLCRIKDEFSECAFGHSPVRHLASSKQDSSPIPAYLKHEGFSSSIPRWAFARFIKNIPSCLEESSWLASSSSPQEHRNAGSAAAPMCMSFQPNVLAISTWNRSEEVIVHDVDGRKIDISSTDSSKMNGDDSANNALDSLRTSRPATKRNNFVKTRVQVDSGECFWMINPLFIEPHLSVALQSMKHYLNAISIVRKKHHRLNNHHHQPNNQPYPLECKVMSAEVAPEAWSFDRLKRERLHKSSILNHVDDETDITQSRVIWTSIRSDANHDDDVLVSAVVDSISDEDSEDDDDFDDYDFVKYAQAKLVASPPSIAIRKTDIREFVVGATNTDSPDIKLSVCSEICVDRNIPHSFHMTRSPIERVKILSSSNLTMAPVVADLSDDFNEAIESIHRQASSSMDLDPNNDQMVAHLPSTTTTTTLTNTKVSKVDRIPPISRLKCRRSVLIGGGSSSVVGRTISFDVIQSEQLNVRPIWRMDVTMVWQSPDHMLCRRRYESFMTSNGDDDPLGAEHEPIYEVEIECVDPVFWASRIVAEQAQNSMTLEHAFSLLLGEMVVMANNMWGLSSASLGRNESSSSMFQQRQKSQETASSSLMESLMTIDPQQSSQAKSSLDEEDSDSFHPQSPVYIPHFNSAYYNNKNDDEHQITGSLTSPPQSPKHVVRGLEGEPWYGSNLHSLLLPIVTTQPPSLPTALSTTTTPLYVERRFAR